MGFKAKMEILGVTVDMDVARLIRNDWTDAYLIEIDGDDLRRTGIDLGRFERDDEREGY